MEAVILIGVLVVLAGIIALELGIPVAVMEILFGVIAFNLLGVSSDPWIDFLADLGVLGIMFFAGMEMDADILKRNLAKNLFIGAVIYTVRLMVAFFVALVFFGFSIAQAVLIGISLSTTSLALVYPVVKERGSINREEGQVIISVAMVIDLLSTLSLLFFVQPEHEVFLLAYIVLAILVFYFGPKITRVVFSRYGENIAELEVRFILLFLIAMGFLARKLMLSEVIFAFFLGFIFSEIIVGREDVESKLRGIIFGFLAPVFFFKAGMLMDMRALHIGILGFIITFGIIAYATVYFMAKYIFTRWFDENIGRCAGLIFNFRLSFGIIAAIFGLRMGLIGVDIYTSIVLIILLASIVSSAFLRFVPSPLEVE